MRSWCAGEFLSAVDSRETFHSLLFQVLFSPKRAGSGFAPLWAKSWGVWTSGCSGNRSWSWCSDCTVCSTLFVAALHRQSSPRWWIALYMSTLKLIVLPFFLSYCLPDVAVGYCIVMGFLITEPWSYWMFKDTFWSGENPQKSCPAPASSRDSSSVCKLHTLSYIFHIYIYTHIYMYTYFLSILLWCWCLWNSSLPPGGFAGLTPSAVQQFTAAVNFAKTEEKRLSMVLSTNDISLSNPVPHWSAHSSLPNKAQNPINGGQQRRRGWPAGTDPTDPLF